MTTSSNSNAAHGVMLSSFDTHTDQLDTQAGLLSQLDAAVENFMGDFPSGSGGGSARSS